MTESTQTPLGVSYRPAQPLSAQSQQAQPHAGTQVSASKDTEVEPPQVKVKIPEVFIYYQMAEPDVVN